jgi:beta-lactam-binding protein with PASTA domain
MKKLVAAVFGTALLFGMATPAMAASTAPAPPDLRVRVPSVVGADVRDAVKTLKTGGLAVGIQNVDDCAHINVVVAQDPVGGTIVLLGTRVLLTIGAAPEKGCP